MRALYQNATRVALDGDIHAVTSRAVGYIRRVSQDPRSDLPVATIANVHPSWGRRVVRWFAAQVPTGLRAWWRVHARRFAITWLVTLVIGLGLAVVVGLDRGLETAWAAVIGALTLPLALVVLTAVAICIPLAPFVALAVLADTDVPIAGEVIEGVARHTVKPYYRWFGSRRSPVFWGLAAGVLTTSLALAGLAYVRGAPARAAARAQEARAQEAARLAAANRELLDGLRAQLAATFSSTGAIPESLPPTLDAYRRPIAYATRTTALSLSYTLTSPGADPASPTDDICVDDAFDVGPQHARGKSRLARTLWLATDLARAHFDPPLRCARR